MSRLFLSRNIEDGNAPQARSQQARARVHAEAQRQPQASQAAAPRPAEIEAAAVRLQRLEGFEQVLQETLRSLEGLAPTAVVDRLGSSSGQH
jgi:vacuolar-type H+-ATPase subunit E/Vma4